MPRLQPLCGCGCGTVVSPGKRFIQRHQWRIGQNLGKKMSAAQKKKISITLTGAKLSAETIAKIVAKNTGKKRAPIVGKKISVSLKNSTKFRAYIERMKADRKGAGNPAWKGGTSMLPYPYTWTHKFKERVRDAQGRFCHVCWKTEAEVLFTDAEGKTRKHLDVHHIDGNKQNMDDYNFLVMCHPCHQLVTMDVLRMEVVQ